MSNYILAIISIVVPLLGITNGSNFNPIKPKQLEQSCEIGRPVIGIYNADCSPVVRTSEGAIIDNGCWMMYGGQWRTIKSTYPNWIDQEDPINIRDPKTGKLKIYEICIHRESKRIISISPWVDKFQKNIDIELKYGLDMEHHNGVDTTE